MKNESTTTALDLISQTAFLTTLSTKLEARRSLLQDLDIDLPTDLTLHCESCSHALNSIKARKMPLPPELFKVFPEWDAKYFPHSGSDVEQANEARSLYKQGNGLQYLAELYDLPIESIIEYVHTDSK
jgi:hypothetical protein